MLPAGRFATLLCLAVLLVGLACRRTPKPEEARELLTGKWQLISKNDCKHWGIGSDILILHTDGRLEQHLKLLNGKQYDSLQERWEYMPDHSISLERRLTVSDPQYAGMLESEVLIVEFSNPPTILLNPDRDCFYKKFSADE